MLVMQKAFQVKSQIIHAADFTALRALLPFRDGDIVLTEARLIDKLQLPSFVKVLIRESFGPGPNSEPSVTQAVKAAGAATGRIIGIGGGATLDLAKLLSLEHVLPLSEAFTQQDRLRKARELILVPATPGTGSEVTPYCAVYFPDLGAQLILNSQALYADTVLLCPEFLNDIPFNVFAASSFDAFTHACESYLSALATPFSQLLALQAMKLLICAWQNIVQQGSGMLEHECANVQLAGCMAGISYANAGCAAVHALAYPLCTRLKIAHGEANYLVFRAVMEMYVKKNPHGAISDLTAVLAALLNCQPAAAWRIFDELCQSLLPKRTLTQCGMQEGQALEFTDMVLTRQNMLIANGYVQLSAGEIASIYRSLM